MHTYRVHIQSCAQFQKMPLRFAVTPDGSVACGDRLPSTRNPLTSDDGPLFLRSLSTQVISRHCLADRARLKIRAFRMCPLARECARNAGGMRAICTRMTWECRLVVHSSAQFGTSCAPIAFLTATKTRLSEPIGRSAEANREFRLADRLTRVWRAQIYLCFAQIDLYCAQKTPE